MMSKLSLGMTVALFSFAAVGLPTTERHQFRAKDIQRAEIHNAYGDINIAPTASPIAHVVLTKIKWGPRCDASVDLTKGTLKVEIDDSGWLLDQECRVDLIINLPAQVAMAVQTGTGNVKVLAKRGDIDVKVGSGLIELKGDLKKLKALSGSGDIQMNGVADIADIKTGSGDIELDYHSAPDKGKLALRTGSGDVRVYLPEQAKVNSQISTGNGQVVNEFAVTDDQNRIQVDAASASGDIQIRQK